MVQQTLIHWLFGEEESTIYECRECGRTVDEDATSCPECGSDSIARYEL